jgi:MSHA biogenesis protein MshK
MPSQEASAEPSVGPLQDPTKPSLSVLQSNVVLGEKIEKSEKEELLLQSVFSKKTGYIAIVSGQLVKSGGSVQGFTVTKISPKSITLKKGQIIKTLRLHKNDIKKN